MRVAREVFDELRDLALCGRVRGAACWRWRDGEDVRDEGVVALDRDLEGVCVCVCKKKGWREAERKGEKEGNRSRWFSVNSIEREREKTQEADFLFLFPLLSPYSSYLGRRRDAEAVASAVHDGWREGGA